jgi:hypothetical protein
VITRFELGFEKFHPEKERIFRIVSDSYSSGHGEDHSGSIPDPAPPAIRNDITGFEKFAVFYNYEASVTIQDEALLVKKFAKPKRGEERSDTKF